jgi:hypothetical protein
MKAAKSVTLVGLQNNAVPMDLYIFVIYEKQGLIDCENGK